jgi:hypothetical protein
MLRMFERTGSFSYLKTRIMFGLTLSSAYWKCYSFEERVGTVYIFFLKVNLYLV